jgi:L-fuculose-phosphate aldolase
MKSATRSELIEVGRLLYDRFLTNAAGGNLSARASQGTFYATSTGNSKRTRLHMTPEDLLLIRLDGTVLDGDGEPTSSWRTHRRVYEAFPAVNAIIHTHPRMITAFTCRNEMLPPILDVMKKYGPVPIVAPELTVDSAPFAEAVAEALRPLEDKVSRFGHSVLYPYHGVITVAPSLDDAYDMLERMEWTATAILLNS